ncbi:MAG: outer membrane protein assembly factor BamD [Mailhella sp.]|nr:outer membrane protein assembly factor BamD [Mailhella sp.]MBQ8744349.1 outer membrane protein assembly factor BamD [Mailhella sp.]MBQ9105006.1 outer membrane protein assembly factor BamD [Mailhella sp.]
MRRLLLLGMLVCSLSLSGCAFIDQYFLPPAEDTVQEVFEAGKDAMREKNYKQAAIYFNRIKDEHPFSPYALQSELALADAHFLNEEYWLAAEAYRDFETLHPRHEAIPYVLYQLGQSLRNTYTSIDHSAKEVSEAVEYFTRLQQEYPDTEYGRQAADQILACRRTLAQREIFIANVFWGMENYKAAYTRFQHVVKTYPDVKEEAEYARTKGEAAYLKFRQNEAQAIREYQEGSWKDWFRWL